MLIAHPSSSCDVCLEPFRAGADGAPPCAIQCGHVFCRPCIESFTRLVCPLCRSYFDPRSVRRLHIDLSSSPSPSPARLPRAVLADDTVEKKALPEEESGGEQDKDKEREKEDFKARLIGMVREGAGAARYSALLADITTWLKEQSREDHWDLRVLYLLVIRYQQTRDDLKNAQDDAARARAREAEVARRADDAEALLSVVEREKALLLDAGERERAQLAREKVALENEKAELAGEKAELEEELREAERDFDERYNEAMGEIESLRSEILFFSEQRKRSSVPSPRPSGLSISRPPIDDTDDDMPPPPPPPEPEVDCRRVDYVARELRSRDDYFSRDTDESELEGVDAARFSPLAADPELVDAAMRGDFSPLMEGFKSGVPFVDAHAPRRAPSPPPPPPPPQRRSSSPPPRRNSPPPRRASSPPRRSTSPAPLPVPPPATINALPAPPKASNPLAPVAARFYETIGAAPASLPHPAPASYFARRQDRTRDAAAHSRARANSSSAQRDAALSISNTNTNTSPTASTPTTSNNSNSAPLTRPLLSSKMQQRVRRLQLALIPDSSDEGEVARRAARTTQLHTLLADPARSPRAPLSQASVAAHAFERERTERRRTESGGSVQTQASGTAKQAADVAPPTPPATEPRRPRYLERRDSGARAPADVGVRVPTDARVWLPSSAALDSETS